MAASGSSAEANDIAQKKLAVIRQFVERMIAESDDSQYDGSNRRVADRHTFVTAVEAMPVDPTDKTPMQNGAIAVVARDISTSGVAFLCHGFLNWSEAALRMTRKDGESMTVLMKIVRVRPVGRNYYEVAGTFLRRID